MKHRDTTYNRIMDHNDAHILIYRICEYVTLHGERDFANIIKLRTLRCEDFLDRFGGSGWLMQLRVCL